MKKKLLIFLLIIISLFYINTYASTKTYQRTNTNLLVPNDVKVTDNNLNDILSTPAVSSKEKIYDYADLLTNKQEKSLKKSIDEYISNTTIDAIIVTTTDLSGKTIDKYAYDFYDYNDFLSDGVIFVIYMGGSEPEIYMANSGDTKGKVFTIYTQKRINQILSYVYKDIQKGNYYKACDEYVKILKGYFNLDRNTEYVVNNDGKVVKSIPYIEITLLSFALTFIIVVLFYKNLTPTHKVATFDILDNCVDKSTLMVKTNNTQ